MHVSHTHGLPALAIVLPHPQLTHSRSPINSMVVSSPRTPRTPSIASRGSNNVLFASSAPNRNSTDSWNSSNADEMEWEWKPEQLRFLSRTLDALPSHLVTPFNGPIPPPNLLDKIARGVSNAKGPIDWPHSLRATRVKLIEMCRARAKEAEYAASEDSCVDMDGNEENARYPAQAGKTARPLYRQSSMDFIQNAELKKDARNIAGVTERIQKNDKPSPGSLYHPYARNTSRASPRSDGSSLMSPSTPSSSTLNTISSLSVHNRRRASSNLSVTSISSVMSGKSLPDPRVQRLQRSESFRPPAPPVKDDRSTAGVKRAPSFGTLAQEAKRTHDLDGQENRDPGSYASSDEEEKARTKTAKKMRVKESKGMGSPIALQTGITLKPSSKPSSSSPLKASKTKLTSPPALASPAPVSPLQSRKRSSASRKADAAVVEDSKNVAPKPAGRPRHGAMNLQRNPSMFGAELPHLQGHLSPPDPVVTSRSQAARSPYLKSPTKFNSSYSPYSASPASPSPPGTPENLKTLRRVRRLAPGRRISFGSLVAPGEEADGEEDASDRGGWIERQRQRELTQLESAFQLR